MTSHERLTNPDKGTPHFPNMDDDDASSITASEKEVFKGQILIDRLLVYYSKFQGSRDRAARYAQKLLDLGHIESLTNSTRFQDSGHVYRWTDATKLNRPKEVNMQNNSTRGASVVPVPRCRVTEAETEHFEEIGKAILKISIETDSSKDTEIQARIRASPRNIGDATRNRAALGTKNIHAITEDSFFKRRTLSYLTDADNDDVNGMSTNNCIAEVTTPTNNNRRQTFETENEENSKWKEPSDSTQSHVSMLNGNKDAAHQNSTSVVSPENVSISPSPRKQSFKNYSPLVTKRRLESVGQEKKSCILTTKSATDPSIVKRVSPGADATSQGDSNSKVTNRENSTASNLVARNGQEETKNTIAFQNGFLKRNDHINGTEPYQNKTKIANGTSDRPTFVASTQTSEKSILEASKLFNKKEDTKLKEIRPPSPAPRSKKKSESSANGLVEPHNDGKSKREEAKWKELQRVNSDQQQKKTRFNDTVSKTSPNSDDKKPVANAREESEVLSEREMSLHSTGNAEDMKNIQNGNEYDSSYIPVSPLPPSPSMRLSPDGPLSQPSPMKSLFWTKISNEAQKGKKKVFWEEMDDLITFNHTEFEKLFSKPPPSTQTPRIIGDRAIESGGLLKVLTVERSRHVGIRANTIRLAIEEIHDAIIDMDDEKLDIDALMALYDIRSTPEELDEIAEALKRYPNAILDKPEQFVLMLAMTPSLDERLRCWIFAKKFPDKIVEIQEQILAFAEACNEIMQSVTLKRVLEAILLLGNHMNKGTQRGDAYGYHLDILPKLKDVKSRNGETNLLEYIVKVIREQMKLEGRLDDQLATPRNNEKCGLPDGELLTRAISVSLSDLGDELESQSTELNECQADLLPSIVKSSTLPSECETFKTKFGEFLEKASEKLRVQAQLYQDALLTAEDFQIFFNPKTDADTKETVATMLRSVAELCADFRQQWYETHREEIKEEFYKIQKLKRERQAEIQVSRTPSALKERFIQRRRRNVSFENGRKDAEQKRSDNSIGHSTERQSSVSTKSDIYPQGRLTTPIPKRTYKFEDNQGEKTHCNGSQILPSHKIKYEGRAESASYADRVSENSFKIEQRMQELHSKRKIIKS